METEIPLSPPFSKGEINAHVSVNLPPLVKGGQGGFERRYSYVKPGHKPEQLQALRDKIGDCKRCKLWSSRTNIVFGTGNPDTSLMFVGEGPGQEEDRQGEPFVGRAGELLTRMITAMGLKRDDVYIANVIKCRPPGNRNPEPDEIAACRPFLNEQIEIIRPDIICALGAFAAHTLLDTATRISDLRGKVHDKGGHKIVATFHPAYLLRNPNEKGRAWQDLQIVMRELGLERNM
ncbi:MAG: uracil-DNA glycosylase [Nitrospirae bacterium]|nr:uracil-DNA glycosylase [Nitrospirota bacterium]